MMKPFQVDGVAWLGQGLRGALFADMGVGKTAITLTHIVDHKLPTLVVSTKRVCELVWEDEAREWEHTQHLLFSYIMGDGAQRLNGLRKDANIWLINIENIQWLMDQPNLPRFKLVVLDELSLWRGMKKRWKSVRKWLAEEIPEVIGLTGKPAPNGYEGLWPQMELIEQGMLGRTMTLFRQHHFWQLREHQIELRPGEADKILARMAPHVHRISNKDLDMPELVENDIKVRIPDLAARQLIAEFRSENYIFENDPPTNGDYGEGWNPGWEITGNSAATAINKLVQMGNGSVYTDDGRVVIVHQGKTEALREYAGEQQGQRFMVAYYYKHDLAAIERALPGIRCMNGDISTAEAKQLKADWNANRIPYMAIHPGSAGHGLNLQEGQCNRVLWFSMVHDLDLYDQLNARVCRQGNDEPTVFIDRLIAGPEDRVIGHSLTNKTSVQDALLQYYEDLK
jgi:SNF2 family DNA or RNA helicase